MVPRAYLGSFIVGLGGQNGVQGIKPGGECAMQYPFYHSGSQRIQRRINIATLVVSTSSYFLINKKRKGSKKWYVN